MSELDPYKTWTRESFEVSIRHALNQCRRDLDSAREHREYAEALILEKARRSKEGLWASA